LNAELRHTSVTSKYLRLLLLNLINYKCDHLLTKLGCRHASHLNTTICEQFNIHLLPSPLIIQAFSDNKSRLIKEGLLGQFTLCKHIIAGGLKDFLCPALQATCEGMSCNCECTEFFSYCYSDCSEEDSGSNEFAPGLPLSTTSNPSAAPTSSPTFACNNMSPTERYQNILATLAAVTEEKLLSDSTSPQARALQWITTEDEASANNAAARASASTSA
jgi:hypothetical protein